MFLCRLRDSLHAVRLLRHRVAAEAGAGIQHQGLGRGDDAHLWKRYRTYSNSCGTVGFGAFLTPGSGIRDGEKNQDPDPGSGSGMNIPDPISESLEAIFGVKIT
jgi:hypothetical protein